MARKLHEFPKDKAEREVQYPWDRWFDGSVWKITKNEDFEIGLGGFMFKAYSEASKRDLIIRVKLQDTSVIVQAFTPEQVKDSNVKSVSQQRKRKNATRVRLDEKTTKELVKMKKQGYSNAEIAKHFGVSESTVYNKTRVA